MTGVGISHGALSVVNAIGCKKGAAFGISLETRAEVEFSDSGFTLEINSRPAPADFAKMLIQSVCPEVTGAKIKTVSNIPIAKGLKSGSAAANAILLATCSEAGLEKTPEEILFMNTRVSIAADISVTGALDDAAACLLGGLVFSDNAQNRILERRAMPQEYAVVIHVPKECVTTCAFPAERFAEKAAVSETLFAKARAGNIFSAMYQNGSLVAEALGLTPAAADFALQCGATAAGFSGCGPATGILVEKDQVQEFLTKFGCKNCITAEIWNGDAV
ncbi:MAG TPA: shikimate kinase [Methanocorpusculum sp.]|nr:shikimate kinase [Methanocorpusculum sp.]